MINYSSILKINSKMDIQVHGLSFNLKTMIQEVTSEHIAIHVPSYRGRERKLNPGDYVTARVFSKDAQYVFKSTVLGQREEKVILYLLSLPSHIERIQMRDFVRVKVQMPAEYRLLKSKEDTDGSYKKCFTVDMSGGGLQIVVPELVETGALMALRFTIQDSKDEDVLIKTFARVKRRDTAISKSGRYVLGISFEDIDERDRDQIIAFVYKKILEERLLEVER
ncbi:MAG: hypothetical protein GX318_01820 [Clostridia bacterium]|nr:hypothetical protein [Clostridia bacterium]